MGELCNNSHDGGCGLCPVRGGGAWDGLPERELVQLSRRRVRREYRSGEALFAMGEQSHGIHCISGGAVGVRKMDVEGNSVLLCLAYPGDLLGYRSLLYDGEHRTSAEAIGPSVICFVDAETVLGVLARNPALGIQFLRCATRDLENAHETLVKNGTLSNRLRFIHLLAVLHKHHGRAGTNGSSTIELPVSRRDLATMIGTRHETLSRIIHRLEDDGLAFFSGRHVRVPCVDSLIGALEPHLCD